LQAAFPAAWTVRVSPDELAYASALPPPKIKKESRVKRAVRRIVQAVTGVATGSSVAGKDKGGSATPKDPQKSGTVAKQVAPDTPVPEQVTKAAVKPQPVRSATRLPVPQRPAARSLSAERLGKMMETARVALLDEDYPQAIKLYTRILQEPPNPFSAEALEFLGLARERNGQAAHAAAEYRHYIELYPDTPGAERVGQRLLGLVTAREVLKPSARTSASRLQQSGIWDAYGGISQYYRGDVLNTDGQGSTTIQSSVLSDADVVVSRKGKRLDMTARATVGHLYDLLGGDSGPGNRTRLYHAYVDVTDRKLDLVARVGRQSLHNSGVLGRFDGAYLSYGWRPEVSFNIVTGFPVDSADDGLNTDRFFYGGSIDFQQLLGMFDVSLFYNIQQVDGIEDRQAVGAELRYFDQSKSLVSTIDYDIGYGDLNSVVALGNWRFDNEITLSAVVDIRNSPYLTTRNALIGQPLTTIDEMLLFFTEQEIRRFAEDRTASTQTYTLGVSRPVFQRFQVNADITMTRFGGTQASGGVQALPDIGSQFFYLVNFIGRDLFKEGDASVLGFRYSDGGSSSTTYVSLDNRFPLTRQLRINPRVGLSYRKFDINDSTTWTVSPSVRTLYQFGQNYLLDLEVGGEYTSGSIPSADSWSYFVYLGYRADF